MKKNRLKKDLFSCLVAIALICGGTATCTEKAVCSVCKKVYV